MGSLQAESRDDVMYCEDLAGLLRQKTASEFRLRAEKRYPLPNAGMLLLTFGVGVVAMVLGLDLAAYVFFIIGVLQAAWFGVMVALRSAAGTAQKQSEIQQGHYPPESAALLLARLRWWNHLIVPKHWARHSRIHDRKYRLDKKIVEMQREIERLVEEEEVSQERLQQLPPVDVPGLAAKITTWSQRLEHETRIANLEDRLLQLHEELALYQALQHKIGQVTGKLEQIERLGIHATDIGDVNDFAQHAIATLEQRRSLVRQVDDIEPGEFLELVNVTDRQTSSPR